MPVLERGATDLLYSGSASSAIRSAMILSRPSATCWYTSAAFVVEWPILAISSASVAPAWAAIVAALCRRSCTRRSKQPSALRPQSHVRPRTCSFRSRTRDTQANANAMFSRTQT